MSKKSRSGIRRERKASRKSIADLNARAVQLGIAQTADFTGLDMNVAEEMITQIQAVREMFPEIMQLDFVGSFGGLERFTGKSLNAPERAVGVFHHEWGKTSGLALNEKVAGPQQLAVLLGELKSNVKNKFHPEGCDTLKSVIDHEIGHWIDHDVHAFRDRKIGKIFNPLFHHYFDAPNMGEVLSRYAETSRAEFIAEAWSEYRNNPKPRQTAQSVGDRMVELYRKVHK